MLKIFLLSIIVYSICIIIKTNKSLQMLQQNRYNRGNKYLKWLKNNLKKQYLTIELIAILIIFAYGLEKTIISLIFNTLYLIIGLVLDRKYSKAQKKVPLNYTNRIKRLFVTTSILYLIVIVSIIIFFNQKYLLFYYILLAIILYFNNLVIVLSNIINMPIEKMINNQFRKKAVNKLKSMSNMKVIGITGSYGKTSSKNILNDILNVKYNAYATPKNYNTPTGLMITINDYLDKFNDYFIAEMGACKSKEIKELCDLVKPTYGIITTIGVAHLETFKSEEAIINTKFELIESLPKDGVGILNIDDPKQVNYKLKNDCKIIWIGINNKKADVLATNINLNNKGTTFDVVFKNDNKKYFFETKLLGKANIYNILTAIALGSYLGIEKEELIKSVKKVKPVTHRLELKKYYDMYLIDDAYNSNPIGCQMALDVLSKMEGKKIVISSGMIELKDKSYELNKQLGEYMVKSKVDEVILIGKEQTRPIYDGLISKKYNEGKIHILNNIMDAFTLIHKLKDNNTYVLLQSDLPDAFNEE